MSDKRLIRVRATFRQLDDIWAEVGTMQLRLGADRPWLNLRPDNRPLVLTRTELGDSEPVLYVRSALKRILQQHGAEVYLFGLEAHEPAPGADRAEWRAWAQFSGPVGVAVSTGPDGTVQVLGLE